MPFDPNQPSELVSSPVRGFDPSQPSERVAGESKLPPSSGKGAPDWFSLYGGLDNLDERLSPEQRSAKQILSYGSLEGGDPKELWASTINQAFIQTRHPELSGAIRGNWPAVKQAFVKQVFGEEANVSDVQLYGKISEAMKAELEGTGEIKAWTWKDSLANAVTPGFQTREKVANFWQSINKPLVDLPAAPESLPDLPHMGVNNPAFVGGIYNGLRPLLEGAESPFGIATLGAGGGLHAASKVFPAARYVLGSMSGVFAGLMGYETLHAAPETKRILEDPNATTQEKVNAVSGNVATGAMALLGSVGAALEFFPAAERGAMVKSIEGKTPAEAAKVFRDTAKAVASSDPIHAEFLTDAAREFERVAAGNPAPTVEATAEAGAVGDAAATAKPAETAPETKAAPKEPYTISGGAQKVEPISIKNEAVDAELAAMGEAPAEHGESLTFKEAADRAAKTLSEDPMAARRLMDDLAAKPRAVTGEEDALLLTELNRLRLEREAAEQGVIEAARTNDPARIAEARNRLETARNDFVAASDVVTKVGTSNAQGLALRRMMMNADYSLAAMERRTMAANDGKPLTRQQEARIRELHQQIQETQAAFDAYRAEMSERMSRLEEQKTQEAAPERSRAPGRKAPPSAVRKYISEQAQAARERIKARAGKLNAGVDPTELADHIIVGADYIASGVTKFAEWSAEMVREFGEAIKPHLDAIFEKAREIHADTSKLEAYKKRIRTATDKLQEKVAAGDTSKPVRRSIPLDAEALRLKAEHERVKQQFDEMVEKARYEALPRWQRAAITTTEVARASALSGYHTLAKLAGYSLAKVAETPLNETLGALLTKLPGVRGIAEKANLEAGTDLKAIATFYSKFAREGMRDAWQTLKTGKSDIKAELGGSEHSSVRPVRWYDYFGISHMAEKAPLLRADFEMRLQRATEAALKEGADVSDPMVQAALRKDAFEYAHRAILQENNAFAKWVNNLHATLERTNPQLGKAETEKVLLSTLVKTFFTKGIVRVPSNYIAQTLERTPLGLVRGAIKAGAANVRGVEALKPVEANAIVRLLKVGAVGSAFFVWGMIDATKPEEERIFGGYYQPGQKRSESDVHFGALRIGDAHIPHLLTHNPITESAQMGSTLMRVASSRLRKRDVEERGPAAGAVAAVVSLASTAPVISPVVHMQGNIERSNHEKFVGELLAGLVPQLVANLADDLDNGKKRTPQNAADVVKSRIPGLRQEVPESRQTARR